MGENKDEQNLIDFKFEWEGKDFDKVAPNVKELAEKLVELKLVKVNPDLDETRKSYHFTYRGL